MTMADTSLVFPSKPVEGHIIKLSLCDSYSPKVWVMQTHFWPCEDDALFDRAYEVLKQGLSRTLTEAPGFAGRTGRTSEDPRDLAVIIGDAAHVEFPADDLTGNSEVPSYAELKEAGFPMTSLIAPFSAEITLTAVHEGAPMLAVKFNKLKGGMALSFGFNHLLADASTIAETERIWALHTTDVSNGIEQRKHKGSPNDAKDRERMSTPIPGTSCAFEDPHWKIFPTPLSQLGLSVQKEATEPALRMINQAKEEYWSKNEGKLELTEWCLWYFSPDQLAQLKKDCSEELAAGEWISTMDALIGLFWSRILTLKKDSRGELTSSTLLFPINIRTRLSPPLHPQYMGNCVDIIAADASIADLEVDACKGWAAAARTIRAAVGGWKQGTWESWLAKAKSLPNEEAICPNPLMLLNPHNIAFNDYSKSQSNLLDWGKDIGRPDRTRYMKPAGSMKGCATGVVVHPRLADGGLEVATTSTNRLKEALASDEIFRRYATLECAFA